MLSTRAAIFVFVSFAQALIGCCRSPSDTNIAGTWYARDQALTNITFHTDHTVELVQATETVTGEPTTLQTGTWHVRNDKLAIIFPDAARSDKDTVYVYVGSTVCRDKLTFGEAQVIMRTNGYQSLPTQTQSGPVVYIRHR